MKTKVHPTAPQRFALHLLCSCALLGGLVGMHTARAEEKIDLIETPLAKKIKLEKPSVSPEPAHTSSKVGAPSTDKAGAAAHGSAVPKAAEPEQAAPGNESVRKLKEVLSAIGAPGKKADSPNKRITLTTAKSSAASTGHSTSSREAIRARALALANGEKPADAHATAGHGGEAHWTYEGENGPQNWGKLKPEFNLCAIGKRQSPIAIRDDVTLLGPAEPIRFVYTPSRGNVVNNGHTIQVDMDGENHITVRGSTYKLLQFHFHTPSEEMINSKRYAMVAHLVHKNDEGQLAVVAVLLEPGDSNPMIETVWTYMPLDTNDRVRIPEGMVDMNQLLPADQRYYQFIGSLTTPPCTEGVLWLVMKQPLRISPAQFKVFTQLFPLNARPVQPLNARPVREAK